MKNSIFAVLTLFAMAVNFAVPSLADTKHGSAGAGSELVTLLPASDGVVTMDAARFFGQALPTILSGNPTLLGKFTSEIEKIRTETGVDIRQFNSVAGGFNYKQAAGKKVNVDPVVVARGQVDAAAMVAAAKVAAKTKFREEKAGARTLVIFSTNDLAVRKSKVDINMPGTNGTSTKETAVQQQSKAINSGGSLPEEMAITAYDNNTIVAGSAVRVRELIAGKSKVSTDITNFLGRTDGSLVDFATNVPAGMRALLPVDDDMIGKNVEAIRFMYGSMSVSGEAASLNATARTLQPEQAKGLKETLDGLQMIGKAFLGSAKGADKQVYARMIENVRFTQTGNELNLSLSVPQSDINVLVGTIR